MAKIDLGGVSSGYLSSVTQNSNNDLLEDTLNNKVLYRDNPAGEPNQMLSDLDMNSQRILNLNAPQTDSEPARWVDVKDGVSVIGEVLPGFGGNANVPLTTNGSSLIFGDVLSSRVSYNASDVNAELDALNAATGARFAFDSLEDLVGNTKAFNTDDVVLVLSFRGDGGKGKAFYTKTGATGTPSVWATINSAGLPATGQIVDANGDVWEISEARPSVMQFGAFSSSAAAQSNTHWAIQNANDYVGTNGGGDVLFEPIGSSVYYHISTGIVNTYGNVRLVGGSPTGTMIRRMDNTNIDMYTCTPGGFGLDNVSQTGIHWNGNRSNNVSGKGLVVHNTHAISHYDHVMVSQQPETGWEIYDCSVIQFNNCYGIGCDGWNWDFDSCNSMYMTDGVTEFSEEGYMRIRNTDDVDTIGYFINGFHFEADVTEPSSGYGLQLSGGATKPIVVYGNGLEFRGGGISANPVRIEDARVNFIAPCLLKAGWGAMVSNADSNFDASGVSTASYSYTPVLAANITSLITNVGPFLHTQTAGADAMKLRRSDFAAIQIGADDDNTWIAQDNSDDLVIQDRRSATTAERMRIDSPVGANTTSLSMYDVDSGLVKRVLVGGNNTGPGGSGRALYLGNV